MPDPAGAAYHAATNAVVEPARQYVMGSWGSLVLSGLSQEAVSLWLNGVATPIVRAMQLGVGTLTSSHLARRLKAKPAKVDESITGRDGVTIGQEYLRPVREARQLMETMPARDALQRTMPRIDAMVKTDAQMAKVRQARASLLDAGVERYKRVPHPELSERGVSCPLCILASTKVYKTEDLLKIHERCNCDVDVIERQDLVRVGGKLYVGLRTLDIPEEYTRLGPRGGNAETAYYLEQMAKRNWDVVDEAYYALVQEDWHSDIGPMLAAKPRTPRVDEDFYKRANAVTATVEPKAAPRLDVPTLNLGFDPSGEFADQMGRIKRWEPQINLAGFSKREKGPLGMMRDVETRVIDNPDAAKIIGDFVRATADLAAEYPEVAKGVTTLGFREQGIGQAFAATEWQLGEDGHSMLWLDHAAYRSPKTFNKDFAQSVKNGFFFADPDTSPGYYVAAHEWGHVMSNYTGQILDNNKEINLILGKAFIRENPELAKPTIERPRGITPLGAAGRREYHDWLATHMSDYSLMDDGTVNPAEAIAEAFADVTIHGAAASPTSHAIYDELTQAVEQQRLGGF